MSEQKFQIEIDCGEGSAFEDEPVHEVCRILKAVRFEVEAGFACGDLPLYDVNGNRCGVARWIG